MGFVGIAFEVDHTVQASIGGAIALVAMAIELLLGEDIPTVLLQQFTT